MAKLSQDMFHRDTLKKYGLGNKTFDLTTESDVATIAVLRFFSKLSMNDSSVLSDFDKGYQFNLLQFITERGVSEEVAFDTVKFITPVLNKVRAYLTKHDKLIATKSVKFPIAKTMIHFQKIGKLDFLSNLSTAISSAKILRLVDSKSKPSSKPHTSNDGSSTQIKLFA